jgi:hypothetical protein
MNTIDKRINNSYVIKEQLLFKKIKEKCYKDGQLMNLKNQLSRTNKTMQELEIKLNYEGNHKKHSFSNCDLHKISYLYFSN